MLSRLIIGRLLPYLAICTVLPLSAQTEGGWTLDSVEIRDTRIWKVGQDSAVLQSLAVTASDLLSQRPDVYLRLTAPGLLSTISINGLTAQQTPVMWQDVNLQGVMNGVYDLNLLPVQFLQPAVPDSLFRGGLGNGAPEGILFRSPVARPDSRLTAGYQAGSFHTHQGYLSWTPSARGYHGRVFGSFLAGANDFPYRNITRPGAPRERLEHGAYRVGHAGTDQFLQTRAGELRLHVLATVADREIPPSLTETAPSRTQRDSSLKMQLRYLLPLRGSARVEFRSTWIGESMQYDTFYHQTRLLLQQVLTTWDIIPGVLQVAPYLHHQYSTAGSDNYVEDAVRNMFEAGIRYRYSFARDFFHTGRIKWLWLQERRIPVNWELGAGWQRSHWRFDLVAGRYTNLPSLNDLYWEVSGNPDLEPEEGRFGKLVLSLDTGGEEGIGWRAGIDAGFRETDDFILWRPSSGILWRPGNVKLVHTWHGRFFAEKAFLLQRSFWRVSAAYQYTAARNAAVYENAQLISLGKRLIYQPAHQANAAVHHTAGQLQSGLTAQYTGLRYTNADNSQALSGYLLLDIYTQYRWKIGRTRLVTGISLRNLTNAVYETVAYRPMPGFYFSANIQFIF